MICMVVRINDGYAGERASKKGTFNIDLIISSTLFIVGLLMFIQLISYTITTYEAEVEDSVKSNIAQDALKILFSSEGKPKNWNEDLDNVEQLGLCTNSICLLTQDKIDALSAMDTNKVKSLLNLNGYDIRILIKKLDGAVVLDYKTGDEGGFMGISQKKCLMVDGDLTQIYSTVQVW